MYHILTLHPYYKPYSLLLGLFKYLPPCLSTYMNHIKLQQEKNIMGQQTHSPSFSILLPLLLLSAAAADTGYGFITESSFPIFSFSLINIAKLKAGFFADGPLYDFTAYTRVYAICKIHVFVYTDQVAEVVDQSLTYFCWEQCRARPEHPLYSGGILQHRSSSIANNIMLQNLTQNTFYCFSGESVLSIFIETHFEFQVIWNLKVLIRLGADQRENRLECTHQSGLSYGKQFIQLHRNCHCSKWLLVFSQGWISPHLSSITDF